MHIYHSWKRMNINNKTDHFFTLNRHFFFNKKKKKNSGQSVVNSWSLASVIQNQRLGRQSGYKSLQQWSLQCVHQPVSRYHLCNPIFLGRSKFLVSSLETTRNVHKIHRKNIGPKITQYMWKAPRHSANQFHNWATSLPLKSYTLNIPWLPTYSDTAHTVHYHPVYSTTTS